jgi:chromosomal replication initiator protein
MEAFAQIFRELHSEGKHLVIAGCCSSKELSDIVDCLDIPMDSGLIVEIEQPDYETKLAILRSKAEHDRIVLSDECSQSIAATVSNVRELEGALVCWAAHASFT